MKAVSRDESVRGALYGALVGDALGVPVEFSSREQRLISPVREMRAFGTWRQPAGTWSDDGSLLLCTVEGLLEEFDLERLGALFVRWMRNGHWSARGQVFDIGITTSSALARIDDGQPARFAGMNEEDQNGNGSLMRILPIALRYPVPADELAQRAFDLSRVTHAHPRSQLACAIYCLFAAQLLQGKPPLDAYAAMIKEAGPLVAAYPSEKDHFNRVLGGTLQHVPRERIKSGGYVIETLEAAIWCVLRHRSFSDTVLEAVNLGGDTDTTGCVAGGLAGIVYGFAEIPSEWVKILPQQQALAGLIAKFTLVCPGV